MKTNMQKYPAYKDSGVEWLGEIPSHWEAKKLKFLGNIYAGLNGKKSDDFTKEFSAGIKSYIPFTNICNNIKISENQFHYVKVDKKENQNRVLKNDILFLMSSETLEDIAKNSIYIGDNEELYLNSFCKGFRISNENVYPEYINYLFLSATYRSYFSLVGRGFTRINLKQEFINDAFALIPPLPEQTAIAAFLDRKTALIDQAIGIKQKQIELLKERRQILIHKAVTRGLNPNLKLKHSGVEWIGEIPEEWDKSHLKWMSKLFAGGTPDKANLKYWENGTIPWLASGEVNQEIVKYPTTYITNIGFKNSSARWIEKDSLIVALAGQGKTKGMVAYLDISTTGNQSLAAVIPNKERLFTKYLFFYLMAAYKELRGVSGEGQRDGLNLQKLGDIDICIPSIEEQINISGLIETASKKIFETISLKEQEIEKLKEYKATLINSAVTGKIQVC